MKGFLTLFVVYGSMIFWAFNNLIGIYYDGKESSNSYILYWLTVLILTLSVYIFSKFKNKLTITLMEFSLLFLALIILAGYIITFYLRGSSDPVMSTIYSFGTISISSLLIGFSISRKKMNIESFAYFSDIMMLVCSMIFLPKIFTLIISGMGINDIKAYFSSYQSLGYMITVLYGLNLYYLIYYKSLKYSVLKNNKAILKIKWILLICQAIGILYTGARGPMIFFASITLILLYGSNNKKFIIKIFVIALLLLSLIVIILPFTTFDSNTNIAMQGIYRFFSLFDKQTFIATSGDTSASTRIILYKESIDLIYHSPIWGYGLGSSYYLLGFYPHNLLLELLIDGGVLWANLWLILIFKVFKKIFMLCKKDPVNYIILILAVKFMVMLMFSGSYVTSGELWFTLSYVLTLSVKSISKEVHV